MRLMSIILVLLLAGLHSLFTPLHATVAGAPSDSQDTRRGFWVWSLPDPSDSMRGDFWRWTTSTASSQLRSEFWAWYLQVMPPRNIRVKATRRGMGEYVYVFVRDEDWQSPVTQEDVDRIVEAFERSSPANPDKGIYQIATDIFGRPPDKDGDPRIYILILELGEFHGHHFDGFFRYVDQTDAEHSNKLDIIYVDAYSPYDEYHLGVLSHEFQHLIHWRYDQREEGWVNETLSEICMILCGYYTDKKHVVRYLENPDRALVTKVHGGVSYGACLLWGTYVYDRLGKEFLGTWVSEKSSGIDGFNAALKSLGREGSFLDYFGDWMVTLYLNDPEIKGGRYHLRSIDLPISPGAETISSYPTSMSRSVNGFGIDYLRFDLQASAIGELGIALSGKDHPLMVRVMKINREGAGPVEMESAHSEEIALKIDNTENLYREVVLAVTVPEVSDKPVKYRLTAMGVPLGEAVETAIVTGD